MYTFSLAYGLGELEWKVLGHRQPYVTSNPGFVFWGGFSPKLQDKIWNRKPGFKAIITSFIFHNCKFRRWLNIGLFMRCVHYYMK